MQDEILGRLWAANHDRFSADLGRASDAAASKVRRSFLAIPMPLRVAAVALAASITSLTAAAPPTYAQQITVEAPAVQVAYGDLKVGTAAGRATLEARVRGAARALCEPAASGTLGERQARHACYHQALNATLPQLELALAARRGSTLSVAAR